MNRRLTNFIRYVMDECLPPVLRDNKYFMYPFFYFAYRGKNIRQVMEFKSRVYEMDEEAYRSFYQGLNSISRNRETDLNSACIEFILAKLEPVTGNLLDVGCGSGGLLRKIRQAYSHMDLSGSDIVSQPDDFPFPYRQGNIHQLTMPDNAFEVVTCCHTLEHVVHLKQAVAELMRVARHTIIIVVPCQRYFYYTLDEHINFFTHESQLYALMGIEKAVVLECRKLQGDWAMVIDCQKAAEKAAG